MMINRSIINPDYIKKRTVEFVEFYRGAYLRRRVNKK